MVWHVLHLADRSPEILFDQIGRSCQEVSPQGLRKGLIIHELIDRTLYWNIFPVVSIAMVAVWCGVILTAKYYNCDPVQMGIISRSDQMMPFYVMETMSTVPGIGGLFTACIFSGALSTLSSGFNSLAAVTWDDMLKGYFTEKSGKYTANLTKAIGKQLNQVELNLMLQFTDCNSCILWSHIDCNCIHGRETWDSPSGIDCSLWSDSRAALCIVLSGLLFSIRKLEGRCRRHSHWSRCNNAYGHRDNHHSQTQDIASHLRKSMF